MAISEKISERLYKQGYRIVGNHSAVKVCTWSKKALLDKGNCYKEQFYGIKSHQCVQMAPALHVCTHRCEFCWRDIEFTNADWIGEVDEPKAIVHGCIEEHRKFLVGLKGNENTNMGKFGEAYDPKHFAISLSGEPTFYPRLGELIDEVHRKEMTSFLVTNGTNPEALRKLIGEHEPTQLYITLPAPNPEVYAKVCAPLVEGTWEKILESLSLMKEFKCRRAIRLTLAKDLNMVNPEEYAELMKTIDADFFEIKAYMHVGYSINRLRIESMPRHHEVKEFAEKLAELTGLKILDEKEESRVVLLGKEKVNIR